MYCVCEFVTKKCAGRFSFIRRVADNMRTVILKQKIKRFGGDWNNYYCGKNCDVFVTKNAHGVFSFTCSIFVSVYARIRPAEPTPINLKCYGDDECQYKSI